jgi:RNA polymerase sigma factor (TIGR02999 family)
VPEHGADDVVDLLTRAGSGDLNAADALLPHVYDALYALARRHMAREPAGHTLQPTALVNEAYLRLVGSSDTDWSGRGHFYAAAAQAMRRILVERARRVGRDKHGGGRRRVPLEGAEPSAEIGDQEDMLALDEALVALQECDARAAQVVMLRYFAGLTVEDTARALDLSERTVRREWNHARLWLYERMTGADPSAEDDEGGDGR